jgi:RNA polymerase sigma-70 factor (ECF subfamily)
VSREPIPTDERDDPASPNDDALLAALRAGDESAFAVLVEREQAAMLRVARLYVPTRAMAEDVVQETWVGVLTGLDRFEGRSSLRTWIYRILMNIAKTRGVRERRTVPVSSLLPDDEDQPVDASWFRGPEDRWAGHWTTLPPTWDVPEDRLLSAETRARVGRAIEALPDGQRAVITLRDVYGWTSADVCNVLDITETNQRVLLHRARTKVRLALDAYLREEQ